MLNGKTVRLELCWDKDFAKLMLVDSDGQFLFPFMSESAEW